MHLARVNVAAVLEINISVLEVDYRRLGMMRVAVRHELRAVPHHLHRIRLYVPLDIYVVLRSAVVPLVVIVGKPYPYRVVRCAYIALYRITRIDVTSVIVGDILRNVYVATVVHYLVPIRAAQT